MPELEPVKEPGIYTMLADKYHADPAPEPSLSSSIAKVLLTQSPAHAKLQHPRLNPTFKEEESDRFDIGSAAHSLLLEGDGKMCVVDAKDWRTNAAKEQRDTARANGLYPVLPHQEFGIRTMVKVARDFMETTELAGIFDKGKPEQSAFWRESDTWCRARLDWLADDVILDYKTTESANPEGFSRQIIAMNHHVQAAMYQAGIYRLTGSLLPFIFLVQEITLPYACSLVGLSTPMGTLGERRYYRALKTWKECLKSGNWSSYTNRICYAEPPTWALAQEEEIESQKENQ